VPPALTATLIVRNEAAVLRRCLSSLYDIADELVVVDTGSTDNSPQIASEFGAFVISASWQGDFSTARNLALSHAHGSWILYIDADESARPVDRDALTATLNDRRLVAATVKFRSRTGFTRYRECRLFRNDPRIRFHNVIHETMMADVHTLMRNDGRLVGASELAIDHFGYDGNQERKHRRNIPLLRARLARDPDHVYSWNHLGQSLAGLGDTAGAVAAWHRAIDVVRAVGVRSPLDALPYGSLLTCREAAPIAADLLDEALQRFPRDYLFRWLQSCRLIENRRWADALVVLEDLAAIEAETFYSDEGLAYDARIFGVFAYEAAALCHFRLGRYRESARYYERAGITEPEDPAHEVRKRLAVARWVSTAPTDEDWQAFDAG
jgi:glycosyltransferase involved in cell wall biosynthesis